jgi:putative transposase
MSDRLFDEKPFRILTIVDCFTREALASAARTNFRAYQVIEELDRLARIRGKPRSIRVDNGPEFAGRLLDQWAYLNKVELDFSRPHCPAGNRKANAERGKTNGQCLHRGLQQPPAPGMSERVLVPVHGRRPHADQQLEDRLQRNQAAFIARKLDAKRLCGPTERNPKDRMKSGPETG